MAEYIERAELISAIKTCKSMMNTGFPKQNMTQKDMMRIIEEIPAADVAPVVHGEWVEELEIGYDGSCNGVHNRCSACSEWFYDVDNFNYCPNCGAKMDGE